MKKVEYFSLYLYYKLQIYSNLKIQKILFLLRVYEKIKNLNNSPIFDDEKDNFQAWIYGPVNVCSYHTISNFINSIDQISDKDLLVISKDEYIQECKQYIKIASEINEMVDDPTKLVGLTHKNLSYKDARKNIEPNQPCCNTLDEKSDNFIKFDQLDEFEKQIINIISD